MKNPFHGKVLLFFPADRHLSREVEGPDRIPPPIILLGLASMAMYARHHAGIDAYVYCSPNYSPEDLANIIRLEKPSVIGVSCWSYNRFSCLALARIAKSIDPKIVVVFGGIHATFLDWQILSHYPEVDYIVRGEGELTFFKLLAALAGDGDIAHIDGLSFRRDGALVRTPDQKRCQNLDDLPLIDYKTISIGTSLRLGSGGRLNKLPKFQQMYRTLPVETSRGCPFSCKYCSGVGFMHGVTRRSVGKVIEQIDRILELDTENMMWFHDMNFTLDRRYTMELCGALISHKIKVPWCCSTRINLVDKELLMMLRKAGCEGIFYGVDSLSKKVLYSMGRKYDPSLAIENLNLTASLGIMTQMQILIGFPGETDQDRLESLKNLSKVHKDTVMVGAGVLIFPGSEIYEMALREGFDESYWLSEHEEPFPFYTGTLSTDEMQDWIKRFKAYIDLKQRAHTIVKSRNVPLP